MNQRLQWASQARRLGIAAGLVASASLAACGGGGNESGPPDNIQLSMTDITVGEPGVCYAGTGPTVHVYGGTPPYKVSNSLPQGLALTRTLVPSSGDGFRVDFIGNVCMKGMPITVEDDMGRLAKLVVNNGV